MLKVVIVGTVGLLLVLFLSGFSGFGGGKSVARESRGPFDIETVVKRISSGGFPNMSSNPFERMEVTEFRLYHRGKPLAVETKVGKLDSFWEARFLAGAPRPAVLLATTGLWLVSEENGVPRIENLKEQDTNGARIQWLDGAEGLPAKSIDVGIRDARGEPRSDNRGSLLLLGRGVVLDVRTLTIQRYRPFDAAGYNVSNADALRLSPGRSQYVMLGQRSSNDGNGTAYAMVVSEPGRQAVYALPFDRKATRLVDVDAIDAAWFDHHFTWSRDASGAERLVLRTDAAPFPHQGRIVNFGGSMIEYHLNEVTPSLQRALLAFLVERFDAKLVPLRPNDVLDRSGAVTSLRIGVREYKLNYALKDKRLLLSFSSVRLAEEADAYARLKEAAQAFNAVLATGRHQELFDDAPAK